MLKKIWMAATAIVAPLLFSSAATAFELKSYTAIYETSYGVMSARGERKVEARNDGTWQIESNAHVLNFDVNQKATFSLKKQHLVPLTYHFENPFTSGRNQSLTFDWSKNLVTDSFSKLQHPLTPNTYDKLSYQVQLQLNVCANPDKYQGEEFRLVDRKKVKTFRAEVMGREVLKTALGQLNTIHLRLFKPGKEAEQDEIWLATDWQCVLVQLNQNDNGDAHTLKLVSAKIGGKDVVGK